MSTSATIRTHIIPGGTTGTAAARLARGIGGRPQKTVDVETLARTLEAEGSGPGSGVEGLLADLELVGSLEAQAGVTVLPALPVRRRGLRLLAAAGIALTVLGTVLGVQAASAPRAHAAVLPLTRPVVVTVAGPTARLDADVVSTAPMFRDGGHAVRLFAGQLVLAATGGRGQVAVVHIGRTVPSRLLTPGTTTAGLLDVGDGRTSTVPLTVLRQSRVTLASVTGIPGGVLVTGRAAHYDIPTGTYRGDQLSTVLVQRWTGRAWVTAATAPTFGPGGDVAAVVPALAGPVTVRLVRERGATVTGAASAARAAVAYPVAGGWPMG